MNSVREYHNEVYLPDNTLTLEDAVKISQMQEANSAKNGEGHFLGKALSPAEIMTVSQDPHSIIDTLYDNSGNLLGFGLGLSKQIYNTFPHLKGSYGRFNRNLNVGGTQMTSLQRATMQVFISPQGRSLSNARTLLNSFGHKLLKINDVAICGVSPDNRAMHLQLQRMGYGLSMAQDITRNNYSYYLIERDDGKIRTCYPEIEKEKGEIIVMRHGKTDKSNLQDQTYLDWFKTSRPMLLDQGANTRLRIRESLSEMLSLGLRPKAILTNHHHNSLETGKYAYQRLRGMLSIQYPELIGYDNRVDSPNYSNEKAGALIGMDNVRRIVDEGVKGVRKNAHADLFNMLVPHRVSGKDVGGKSMKDLLNDQLVFFRQLKEYTDQGQDVLLIGSRVYGQVSMLATSDTQSANQIGNFKRLKDCEFFRIKHDPNAIRGFTIDHSSMIRKPEIVTA